MARFVGGGEWGHGTAMAAFMALGRAEVAGSEALGSCGGVSGSESGARRACLSEHQELSKIDGKK